MRISLDYKLNINNKEYEYISLYLKLKFHFVLTVIWKVVVAAISEGLKEPNPLDSKFNTRKLHAFKEGPANAKTRFVVDGTSFLIQSVEILSFSTVVRV